MIKEFVIGLIFLLNAQGQPVTQPLVAPFETMQACEKAAEDLAKENAANGEIYMACITPEQFERNSNSGSV